MPGVVGSRMQGCFQVKHDVFFFGGRADDDRCMNRYIIYIYYRYYNMKL